jgi:hypothetical protein
MEAYSAPVGYVFSLNAGGRSGTFDVIAGDFSTELSEDTSNGIYIGLFDNPTASIKVAKRRLDSAYLVSSWFSSINNALIVAKGSKVYIPKGTYLEDIVYEGEVNMEGSLEGVTLSGKVELSGSFSQLSGLSENVIQGSQTLTTVATDDVQTGDFIILHDTRDGSFSSYRTYYNNGEFLRVFGRVGTTVETTGKVIEDYEAANVNLYKLHNKSISLKNLTFNSSEVETLKISLYSSVVLEDIKMKGTGTTGLVVEKSYNVQLVRVSSINTSDLSGTNYGAVISNCQEVDVYKCNLASKRHGLALGGAGSFPNPPTRNVRVVKSVIGTTSIVGTPAADVHGNVSGVIYKDSRIDGVIAFSGENVSYSNCTILANRGGAPTFSTGSEVVGGIYLIENCILQAGRDNTGPALYFRLGSTILNAQLRKPLRIVVSGCEIQSKQLGNMVQVQQYGNQLPVSVEVINTSSPANCGADVLRFIQGTGVPAKLLRVSGSVPSAGKSYLISDTAVDEDVTMVSLPTISGIASLVFDANSRASEIKSINISSGDFGAHFHRDPDVTVSVIDVFSSGAVPLVGGGDSTSLTNIRVTAKNGDYNVGDAKVAKVKWEATANSNGAEH